MSQFVWFLDKLYTRYTSVRFWSVLFLLSWGWNKGEDPKGRKRRSGNFFHPHQFDNIILTKNVIHWKENSINIQHLTPVHEKCFCCLCNIIKTEVTFDFRKNNQKLPATPILSLCWAEVKHRIVCCTIIVGNRSNKCNYLGQADSKGHWCSYGPDIKILSTQ